MKLRTYPISIIKGELDRINPEPVYFQKTKESDDR